MVISMKLIERTEYLTRLINVIGTPDIKVITGIRRCGKSKLLESLKKYINQNINNSNIIHINFNLPKFETLTNYKSLYDYISGKYKKEKQNFILIDEVQMCKDFEKAINWFHAEEKYDIYITGSNAFLMSSDLATLFTGRTIEVEVYPFSLKEYMKYYNFTDAQQSFRSYLKDGGMAGSYLYINNFERNGYIKDVFNTLIVRDIKQKYNIRNVGVLNSLTNYLMDNISNLTSIINITNKLNGNNISITDKTISKYINYLCEAFAFYKVSRYDIKGKRYLSSQDKFYLCDHSFRYSILGTRNMDVGRVYENIVAIELLRRGYEIYVGTLYGKEIDFVAMKQDEKIYIQVSNDIGNDFENETFKREVCSLLSINDAYPKYLIANTMQDTYQYEGIKIVDISNWLINKE